MGKITRNRVMYAGTDVFISDTKTSWENQTGLYDLKMFKRIQSSAISVSNPVNRTRQVGSSDFAFQKYTQTPEITVGLNYYLSDNSNELLLGLTADNTSGIFSNFLESGSDKNLYFILSDTEGFDSHGITDAVGLDIFAVGNAFLDNYSLSAQVGGLPTVDLSFSCVNMTFDTYDGTGQNSNSEVPSINLPVGTKSTEKYLLTGRNFELSNYLSNQDSRVSALRPGDIGLELQQPIMGGARYSGDSPANITSIQINLPIQRRDLVGFGSNFPYDKRVIFPIVGTIAFEGSIDEPITGDFSNIFDDENEYDLTFNFKDTQGGTGFRVEIDKARVESQSFNQAVGDNLTFSSEFSFSVSATDGFRVSGAASFWADDYDAINFLDAINETNTTVRSGINKFVKTLKSEGLWDKISGAYPFVGSTDYYGYNLKDPRNSDEAFRLSFSSEDTVLDPAGTVNFAGTDDYANTHFNPSTDLADNTVHLSFLNFLDDSVNSSDIGAQEGAGNRLLIHVDYGNNAHFDSYFFGDERVTISNIDSSAFYVASRTSDSASFMKTYTTAEDNHETNTNTISHGRPNLDMYFGTVNNNGTPVSVDADRIYGFLSFGKGLSADEATSLYTAVKTLHSDINRTAFNNVFT